jgi:hypothetical protein
VAEDGTLLSGYGIRQFGAWLDDASLITPGDAWTAISFGHYLSSGNRQTDFPVGDASYGMTSRLQLGVSVPYYHLNFSDGTNVGGVGDVYLTAKIALVAPGDARNWGVSMTPILEVLDEPAPGNSRLGVGVPVNAEYRAGRYRVFGSTGFFTRGSLFASGALEVPVHDRLMITGSLSTMRAFNDDAVADALAIPRTRSDISATAAYFLRPTIAVFGGTGRTLTNADAVGSSFLLTAGVSFSFTPKLEL